MIVEGSVFKYGDNVDTDVIIPARYLNTQDAKELASHCMEDIDSEFALKVKQGDIIVGGSNFGCGSSREHAPLAIKSSGVGLVIAKSFARIFYRNSINIGLAILECEQAENINRGDFLRVNLENGEIFNVTKGEKYKVKPFPEFIQNIIKCNGYINSVKENK